MGAVLTTDSNWPDGLVATNYGDSADWNPTVLQKDGANINFVILHYYPSSTTEAGMLAQYQNIATIIKQARAEINEYAGSNAANIQIMVTETNSSYEVDSVPSALYAADTYMTFLENGVSNVDWWDLHNGAGTISANADGSTDYGDGALLSDGGCSGSTCEPATDTPFPAYYGLQAVGEFATAGAEMVATTSSDSAVTAYAVKESNGALSVMLVNHSSAASEPVGLAYSGFTPSSVTSAEQFSEATKKLTTLSGATPSALTLPAYSITVLKLAGSSATGSPSVSASPSSTASATASASPTSSAPAVACTATATKTYDWGNGYKHEHYVQEHRLQGHEQLEARLRLPRQREDLRLLERHVPSERYGGAGPPRQLRHDDPRWRVGDDRLFGLVHGEQRHPLLVPAQRHPLPVS